MENVFSLFGLDPSPYPDQEKLKSKFNELSSQFHPDKFQGAAKADAESKYSQINSAYQTLRSPRDRLLYLYEMEKGQKPPDVQRIPPGTMDLFVEIGQACQEADLFLQTKAKATSALEKATLLAKELEVQDRLNQLQGKVDLLDRDLDTALQALDVEWKKGVKKTDELETIYRRSSYVSRWREQMAERLLALLTS